VPFGEPTTSQYIPVRFTNPRKWDLLERTETYRDIRYGSEKPEVDGSTPSLTTRNPLRMRGISWVQRFLTLRGRPSVRVGYSVSGSHTADRQLKSYAGGGSKNEIIG
jgi:hypothetical protein